MIKILILQLPKNIWTKNRFVSWNVLLQDIFNKTQPIESDFDKIVKGLEKKI